MNTYEGRILKVVNKFEFQGQRLWKSLESKVFGSLALYKDGEKLVTNCTLRVQLSFWCDIGDCTGEGSELSMGT